MPTSISFGTGFSLDDVTGLAGTNAPGMSFNLGNGLVVYTWNDPATDHARFSVTRADGTEVVPPSTLDAATFPANPGPFGAAQDIYAVSPTANGGFTIHYLTDEDQLFPLSGDHFTRSFDASGQPTGPSVPVSGPVPYLTAYNSVTEVLDNGNVAVASDAGVTILGPDGSVVGGATSNPGFRLSDHSYDLSETADGFFLVTANQNLDFATLTYQTTLTGQFFNADGTPDGSAFNIVDGTYPSVSVATGVRLAVGADVLPDGRVVVA